VTIAIDLDGCLVQAQEPYDQLTIGAPVPEAVTAIWIWLAAGHRVILHTCRARRGRWIAEAPIQQRERLLAIREWLVDIGLPDLPVWADEGKPHADLYLDDRALRVTADAGAWYQAEIAVATLARGGAR